MRGYRIMPDNDGEPVIAQVPCIATPIQLTPLLKRYGDRSYPWYRLPMPMPTDYFETIDIRVAQHTHSPESGDNTVKSVTGHAHGADGNYHSDSFWAHRHLHDTCTPTAELIRWVPVFPSHRTYIP